MVKSEVVNFNTPYRMNVTQVRWYKAHLRGERMEEVKDFKYLETVQCKQEEMEGEIRERRL